MVPTSNRDDLRGLLEKQPYNVSICTALRSAMRAAPFLSKIDLKASTSVASNDDISFWFRSLIVTIASVAGTNDDLNRMIKSASSFYSQTKTADFAGRLAPPGTPKDDKDIYAKVGGGASVYATASSLPGIAMHTDSAICVAGALATFDRAIASVSDHHDDMRVLFERDMFSASKNDLSKIQAGMSVKKLTAQKLWPESVPAYLPLDRFLSGTLQPEDLSYWRRFYLSFLGDSLGNWQLWSQIASVGAEDWAQGARRMADVIAELEGESSSTVDPILTYQAVERLLTYPAHSADMIAQAAISLDQLVIEFLSSAELNRLPHELEPVRSVQELLSSAHAAISSDQSKDLKIAELEAIVEALEREKVELSSRLMKAQASVFSPELKKALAHSVLKPTWWATWSGTLFSAYHIMTDPAGSIQIMESIAEKGKEIFGHK